MTTQKTVMARAKQGDAEAIAQLMNRTLSKQATRVQVRRREGEYRFLIESAQLPAKQATVKWMQKGLAQLAIADLQIAIIYGKASDQKTPGWQHKLQFGGQQAPKPDPFAEHSAELASILPAETTPEITADTPAEPLLDLSEYCFTRNKSLLAGSLTPPAEVVCQIVLSFSVLPNEQKLIVLPHVTKLLRKPDPIEDAALSKDSRAWLETVLPLQGNDLRKLSIWLSRYCANPTETVEQLKLSVSGAAPEKAEAEASDSLETTTEEPVNSPVNSTESQAVPVSHTGGQSRRLGQSAQGLSSAGLHSQPAGEKVLFAKGSRTPVWVFPAICALFMAIAIMLGINSVDEMAYLYPICNDSLASSETCMLSVQLLGDELEATYVMEDAQPLTEAMKVEAVENCSDYGYFNLAYYKGTEASWPPPEKADAVELVTSSTTEVFPGVLLTDMVQSSRDVEGETIRFSCIDYANQYSAAEAFEYGQELEGTVVLHRAAADIIPMEWPAEPYALQSETDLSVAKSLGIYDVFISLGANTLFTAVGIFVAVLFCSCYSCYSYKGVYQMASTLGIIETIMHMIPGFGFFASIAMDVVAIGLASRFVKDFNIDWSNGYAPLARGVVTISLVRFVLSLLLYGAIAQFIF